MKTSKRTPAKKAVKKTTRARKPIDGIPNKTPVKKAAGVSRKTKAATAPPQRKATRGTVKKERAPAAGSAAGAIQPDVIPDHIHQILDRRLLVPQHVAALAFGITVPALLKWKIKPRETSGRAALYYLPDLISLRLKRADSGEAQLAEQRARLARLQGDKLDLEVKEKIGELIPALAVLDAWEPILGAVRAKVMALPAKIKRAAPDMSDRDLERVRKSCRAMLEGLANGGIPRRARKGN